MRRRLRAVGALRVLGLLSALSLGCSSELTDRTQIVMTVGSDLAVPADLDRVRVEVTGNASAQLAEADLRKTPLPRTLGLVHGGGPLGPITVRVSGLLGTTTVVERKLVTSFIAHQTSLVSVELESACKNVFCEEGATCVDGTCQGIPVVDPDMQPQDDAGADELDAAVPADDAGPGDDAATGQPGAAPTCQIDVPVAGDAYQIGKTLALSGRCADPETGAITEGLVWSSDVDGALGSMPKLTSSGAHVLSLCATDPRDATLRGCDTVSIQATTTVQPAVSIAGVTQAGSSTQPFAEGMAVDLAGVASGAGIRVTWTDSLQGTLGDTAEVSVEAPVVGRHTLTLSVVDRSGATASASAEYTVLPDGQLTLVTPFSAVNATLEDDGSPRVVRLGRDATGRAYAASEQSSVYVFDGDDPAGQASIAVDAPPLTGNVLDILVAEQAGLAYLGTTNGLTVCPYVALTGIGELCSTHNGSDLPSDVVRAVLRMTATDSQEYLLLGTADGLFIADTLGGSNNGDERLTDRRINALAADSGVAWVASDGGLYRYNPATDVSFRSTVTMGAPSNTLNGVAVDSTGQVWVATANGLGRFAPAQSSWRVWRTQQGLPSNQLNDVIVHRVTIDDVARDVIWIATDAGVSRFDPALERFMNLGASDGLPDAKVLDVLLLGDGSKLFATDAGLARYVGP
jgi:hypothetical protein